MMNLRAFVLALLLALSWSASADIATKIDAVETTMGNVNVPTTDSGRISFRPCDSACDEDYISARVTSSTQYVVKGESVDFLNFRKAFYNQRRNIDAYALVSYDIESRTVTSVRISD